MADILNISDFEEGKNKIPYNTYQQGDLQVYIDRYEKQYLIELLGVVEYNALVNDLVNGVPVTTKFLNIFNPIAEEINKKNVTTNGIKEMLKGFVYFHYMRDNMATPTTGGSKRTKSDNSTNISYTSSLVHSRFNDSIDDSRGIQSYIENNDNDYPDYNGTEIGYSLHI